MGKKWLHLVLGAFIFLISFVAYANELVINDEMKIALKKYNPQFVVWKSEDYSPTIQKDAVENQRAPYYLVVDVNEDKKDDVVLDGHDNKNNLLICLLSTPKNYKVVVIRTLDLLNPKELDAYNDGVKEKGLNYYMWSNKTRTGFTLADPQETDAQGNFMSEGGMIEYIFKEGAFHGSFQQL